MASANEGDIIQMMAKGGKQKGRNEYTDMARDSGQDPCEFLKALRLTTRDMQWHNEFGHLIRGDIITVLNQEVK